MQRLTIETLAHGGDSVARLDDGRAAFISGGCPGDVVLAELTEEHDRYVRGRVTEVVDPSPHRVVPPCPYFGVCGGCQWQHVSYDLQLTSKRTLVVDALERIGGLSDVEVGECVPSTREYGYRNKIELLAEKDERDRLLLGFAAANSHTLVPVDACLLLPSRHAKLPKALSGSLRYASGSSDLGISRVAVRVSERTRDLEVALWTSPGAFPRKAVGATLKEATRATSIVRVLYRGETKRRAIAGVEVLSGKGFWREKLGEYEYAISAPSFFQVNTATAEKLVDLALAAVEPDGSDRVLDLYSGAGTFTLPLSELAEDVVAVEAEGSSVKDLRRNLESSGSWAEVAPGEASRALPELGAFDAAIVDPPRAGLHESVTAALVAAGPTRIAYVSCDPATLARDAKRLAASGYRLTSVTPVDLFPQTWHVESVARFELER
jgi:23S rRNA (uracil1939-C5)-methyltransferase